MGEKAWGRGGRNAHGDVYILHRHLPVDGLHRGAGVLHRRQGFLVDVGGFDGVDLLLEHGDLAVGLFEGVLVLLFALEGRAGSYTSERRRIFSPCVFEGEERTASAACDRRCMIPLFLTRW